MSNTRSNGQGFAGGKGRKNNKLDSRIITREFNITATADASQIDTGIKINSKVQAISAFVVVDTAESTGITKTLSVGVFGGPSSAFLNAIDCSVTDTVGTPVFEAIDTSVNTTIGYTFGSGDWAEFTGTVHLTLMVTD